MLALAALIIGSLSIMVSGYSIFMTRRTAKANAELRRIRDDRLYGISRGL